MSFLFKSVLFLWFSIACLYSQTARTVISSLDQAVQFLDEEIVDPETLRAIKFFLEENKTSLSLSQKKDFLEALHRKKSALEALTKNWTRINDPEMAKKEERLTRYFWRSSVLPAVGVSMYKFYYGGPINNRDLGFLLLLLLFPLTAKGIIAGVACAPCEKFFNALYGEGAMKKLSDQVLYTNNLLDELILILDPESKKTDSTAQTQLPKTKIENQLQGRI